MKAHLDRVHPRKTIGLIDEIEPGELRTRLRLPRFINAPVVSMASRRPAAQSEILQVNCGIAQR